MVVAYLPFGDFHGRRDLRMDAQALSHDELSHLLLYLHQQSGSLPPPIFSVYKKLEELHQTSNFSEALRFPRPSHPHVSAESETTCQGDPVSTSISFVIFFIYLFICSERRS